ncbi:hypothetical protein ACLOAV_004876 [Pseudogymnoascus australis]
MDILKPFTSRLTAHPKLLVSALAVAGPIAYLSYLHASLSKTTSHERSFGPLTRAAVADISSVPASVLAGGEEYKMVRDRAWKRVPLREMPGLEGGDGEAVSAGDDGVVCAQVSAGVFAEGCGAGGEQDVWEGVYWGV